jgi:two-component system, LytTR family, response regulator
MIRALIVDDEALAREGIRDLLAAEPDVAVVGECRDGAEALAALRTLAPDLVLLDVQMPELDGFALLDALRRAGGRLPVVVFVTAHDAYALRAFAVHAIDYLLKPVDRARFAVAMRRARAQLAADAGEEVGRRVVALLRDLEERRRPPDVERLLVKSDGRAFFLKTQTVDWIEAEGNYARIHVGAAHYLVRESLGALERQLDPRQFFRVHRSTIVNVDRVREIQPMFKGDHVVILVDGRRLSLTRKYREQLEQRLGKRL